MISLFLIGLLLGIAVAKRVFKRTVPFSEKLKAIGDPLHVAYAVLTGKLFTVPEPGGWIAGSVLAMLYVVYQLVDFAVNKDTVLKDISVYAGTVAAVVGAHFGIGIEV